MGARTAGLGARRSAGPRRRGLFWRIYQVALRVPRGRVASYGLIARIAGPGCTARQVGYLLAHPEAVHLTERAHRLARPGVLTRTRLWWRSLYEVFEDTAPRHPQEHLTRHAHVLESYTLETLDIQNTLRTKMEALDHHYAVHTKAGKRFETWTIIVATGANPRFLEVPGARRATRHSTRFSRQRMATTSSSGPARATSRRRWPGP